jgi:uncharacterized protein YecE (DUF72 family)
LGDDEEFLDKISPLRTANKLCAVLFQLPTSFTVIDFKNIEQFLDRLPSADSNEYAIELRHPSWGTEGPILRLLLQIKSIQRDNFFGATSFDIVSFLPTLYPKQPHSAGERVLRV